MAIASLAGLTACTTYVVQPPPPSPVVQTEPAPVPPPPPPPVYEPTTVEVVIRDERDFYEPLSPYGHWEYVGSYGRCWVPAGVDPSWRPYCNGHWESTDAGWYWVSDEPWGWATYHYGRWDFDARVGWFWVPQTMWAPAWVSWHRGAGYVGWCPLPPSARIASSGVIEVNTRALPQRGFVVVEERRFLEPVRPTTVVNNTTIINKTVNITNIKVVNNTVINEGPRTHDIEQVSGRKLRPVPARELRQKIETPVAAAHATRGNERDANRAARSAPPVTATPPPAPAVTDVNPVRPSPIATDAERRADERARQEKLAAERKAQAEAAQARKAETDRKAQAEAEQARKAEIERQARLEAEQQRKAEAEAARQKQEAESRARQQAAREALQKHIQMEEARRQELDRNAQAEAEKRAQAKNQTEAERHVREQQKGKAKGQNKKAGESQPAPATNAPTPPHQ